MTLTSGRTYRCLVAVSAGSVALAGACALAFAFMGDYLAVERRPAPVDVGVVLAGDYARALFAADLYREGFVPRLWVTRPVRGRSLKQVDALGIAYPRQEDVTRAILIKKGVPAKEIELIGSGLINTLAEAKHVTAMLAERQSLKRVMVITGQSHVRRAEAIFRHALAPLPQVTLLVIGTPYDEFVADRWWTDRDSARQVVLESVKLMLFWLVTDLG